MLNNKRKYKERSDSREPSTHWVNKQDSYVTIDQEFLNEIVPKPGSSRDSSSETGIKISVLSAIGEKRKVRNSQSKSSQRVGSPLPRNMSAFMSNMDSNMKKHKYKLYAINEDKGNEDV